jgi:hypothetical protein
MFLFCMAASILAQEDSSPPPDAPLRSSDELDQLLGPIALYPDPLIAEILPASTFPSEIVMADRYLSEGGGTNEIPNQGWDASIVALSHYPSVVKWMDDNLAWTTQLGQAFANQQSDVMDAIQRLRAEAENLGNLPNTPQETVQNADGDIEIEPANPDEMYVPDYPPGMIYYQPGVYCTFGLGLPIGLWLGYDWNWRGHGLIYWGPGHPRPHNWWHQTQLQRHNYITEHPAVGFHEGRGGAVGGGRFDRGFVSGVSRPYIQPALPRTTGPRVIAVRPAPNRITPERPAEAFRAPVRESAPAENRSFSSHENIGAFGGFQSGREAQASSVRGQASRAEAAPVSHGGGGGGGERGGGGGGEHGGGGGRGR